MLLDDPPLGLRDEAGVGRVALDDLHVDAVLLAVIDHGLLEPLVDQGFFDPVGLAATPSSRAVPAALSCADASSTTASTTRPTVFYDAGTRFAPASKPPSPRTSAPAACAETATESCRKRTSGTS